MGLVGGLIAVHFYITVVIVWLWRLLYNYGACGGCLHPAATVATMATKGAKNPSSDYYKYGDYGNCGR